MFTGKQSEPDLTKLVSWDIDFYNSLSDEPCLICLSEKDRYVLGQALRQVRWYTRWWSLGGASPVPDTNDIADRLEPKMSTDSCIDICEIMIECIENTPELQQLIAQYALGASAGYQDPEDPSILSSNVFENTTGGCDDDSIFGMTTGLTDLMNNVSEDILEVIQAAPNAIARLGDLIEAIPLIGEAPADDALQLMEKIAEDIAQGYESAYTVALRDEIRCDLFCIAQEDCELTFEEIRDYFQSKLTNSVSNLSMEELVRDIFENNWIGIQTVYIMHFLILETMIFGGDALGIDKNKLIQQVSALYNDPDSDWMALCDPCTADCNLPIVINFEDQTAGSCATIDEGAIQSSPARDNYALVYSGSNITVDPTINVVTDSEGIRNITVTWYQYWNSTLSSPRDVTQQIRAYDEFDNQVGVSSSVVSRAKGEWILVSESIANASADIRRIEIKSARAAGATEITLAIDDIIVSET